MHNNISRRDFVVAAIAATALVACGPFHRGPSDSAHVVFVNESLDQADVYAATSGGDPVRIGTVMGTRTETLTLPPQFASGVAFVVTARLLAHAGALGSGQLTLRPGESVQIRLPSDERTLVVLPGK
jgi:hypothetical protein